MAHEVEKMMYMGETPWHGLGVKIEKDLTVEEAIKEAGLDWQVGIKPIFTSEGELVEDSKLSFRMDTGRQLGTVGKNYHPLQNTKAFNIIEPLVQSKEITIHTAGSLDEGRKIWVLGKINKEPLKIVSESDDIVERYVLLSNSHDGTLAVRLGFTPIRVVCQNTLTFAITSEKSKLVRVRHSSKMEATLEMLRNTMNVANSEFEATAEQFKLLAAKNVANSNDLDKYIKLVFNKKDEDEFRAKDNIVELFEHGRGNELKGVTGTYWAAYNAVTEYLSYHKGRNQDNRLNNLWFGSSVIDNQRALDVALQMVA